MKRSRRAALVVMALALILALGVAATALGDAGFVWPYHGYVYQDAGQQTSYSYVSWQVYDAPVIHLRDPYNLGTTLDLRDSEIATYARSVNLGGVGTNALPQATGVAMCTDGGALNVNNSHIFAYGSQAFPGPQAIYSHGGKSKVTLWDSLVYADSVSGHGLYVQLGSAITAERTTIRTEKSGLAGAAVATGFDNPGTITLHASEVDSYGAGDAAAYYSSGSVMVTDTNAYAHQSEGAWIDGGAGFSKPAWLDSNNYAHDVYARLSEGPWLTGGALGPNVLDWTYRLFANQLWGLVMYNSSLYSYRSFGVSVAKGPMSDVTNDSPSGFAMWGGHLESAKASFYAPNSKAFILLYGMNNYSYDNTLLTTKWTGQGPGGGVPGSDAQTKPGSRESTVTLYATGSQLKGDVITDVDEYTEADSVVNLYFDGWTSYQGIINQANKGVVNLHMTSDSTWQVTGDSYIGQLDVPTTDKTFNSGPGTQNWFGYTPDLSHVDSNGHNVYYGSFANPNIPVETYQLPGGGWLVPALAVQNWFVLK